MASSFVSSSASAGASSFVPHAPVEGVNGLAKDHKSSALGNKGVDKRKTPEQTQRELMDKCASLIQEYNKMQDQISLLIIPACHAPFWQSLSHAQKPTTKPTIDRRGFEVPEAEGQSVDQHNQRIKQMIRSVNNAIQKSQTSLRLAENHQKMFQVYKATLLAPVKK